MSCKLRIGLTGGAGSGKTEASKQFSRLGISVIDTDLIARELVEPGQSALSEIVSAFGEQVLDAAGKLDRARLRLEVFSDPHQRKKLESILHPRIRERAIQRVREALGVLSQRDREMLLLRQEGFSYREIAEVAGVSPRSVGTILARALQRFAKEVTKEESGNGTSR